MEWDKNETKKKIATVQLLLWLLLCVAVVSVGDAAIQTKVQNKLPTKHYSFIQPNTTHICIGLSIYHSKLLNKFEADRKKNLLLGRIRPL